MAHTHITSIGTAVPPFRMSQKDTPQFMVKLLNLNEQEARKLRVLYRATAIDHRYTTIEDYTKMDHLNFFPNDDSPFPSTSERMDLYAKSAAPLAIEAIKNCWKNLDIPISEISHLITVSCTGMYAPGLDIELIEQVGFDATVQRTSINFMGCYAAFNALKVGDAICKSNPKAKVLIVDVEFCTLHFQKSKLDDDLIANSIFADGAAAVLLESNPGKGPSLVLEDFHCDLAPKGRSEMAWVIKNYGFEMKLSTYVPEILRDNVRDLIQKLLLKLDLNLNQVDKMAIHPGGRRILECIEEALEMPREINHHAYHILRNYGNMSSVTVLFVLERIFREIKDNESGQKILSMAFGPGLTIESALLSICA